jgi:hypothetical protein
VAGYQFQELPVAVRCIFVLPVLLIELCQQMPSPGVVRFVFCDLAVLFFSLVWVVLRSIAVSGLHGRYGAVALILLYGQQLLHAAVFAVTAGASQQAVYLFLTIALGKQGLIPGSFKKIWKNLPLF